MFGATTEAEQLEKRAKELDWAVSRGEEALRHHEAKLADARQQIAGFDSTFRHERAAAAGLDAELLKVGRQRAELGYRVRVIEADAARAAAESATAEEQLSEEQRHADAASAALAAHVAELADLDREQTEGQERQFELVRQAASSRSTADSALAQVERMQKEYTGKLHTAEQRAANRAALAHALDGLSQADADVQARLAAARGRIGTLHADRDALADRTESGQTRLEGLRVRQGDLRGRIDVLEDLERSQEGLGAGVRDVLGRIGTKTSGESEAASPFTSVLGLVADLLTVPRDVASLVELALGDTAQRFVVRSPDAVDAVAAAVGEVAGRVGFVPVVASGGRKPPDADSATFATEASGGLRPPLAADSLAALVTCDHPDCAALPAQLLGRVLLADTLADARWLAALHPGCRVITRTGDLLEPDGTLTVGPLKAEAGLVSRKSELRDLREQYRATSEHVARAEVELAELRRQADAAEGVLEAVQSEIALLSDEAGGLLQKIARQRQQVETLDGDIELLHHEIATLERQVREGEATWVGARMEAEEAEHASAEITTRLAELKLALADGEQERDRRHQAHTAAQVALSRAAADRDRARERVGQIDADLRKRKIEALNLQAVDHGTRGRLAESTLAALRASSGQAEAYREKESRERVIAELAARAGSDRGARELVRDRLHDLRQGWQEKQAAAHARELAVHDLQRPPRRGRRPHPRGLRAGPQRLGERGA